MIRVSFTSTSNSFAPAVRSLAQNSEIKLKISDQLLLVPRHSRFSTSHISQSSAIIHFTCQRN